MDQAGAVIAGIDHGTVIPTTEAIHITGTIRLTPIQFTNLPHPKQPQALKSSPTALSL